MKTNAHTEKLESGQVIPLIAVALLAMITMTALMIDGGMLLVNRRTAQAAADAGALAGARHVCYNLADPAGTAASYAVDNGADPGSLVIDIGNNTITVTATVVCDSFFARIFGVETLPASAQATASCIGPRGKGVIPLAWRCWPPQPGKPFNPDYGCQMQTIEWEIIGPLITGAAGSATIADFYGNSAVYHMHSDGTSIVRDPDEAAGETVPMVPKQLYILFDSKKLCIEDGGSDYICDLDGDGKKDIQLGGDRGLVYLTADTNDINKWITSDTTPNITLQAHVWLTAESGIGSAVLKMESFLWPGNVVLVPVYNEICLSRPDATPACIAQAHADPPWPPFYGTDRFDMKPGGSEWYHIIAFQPFYLTCASKSGDCPGYRYAQTINPDLKNNVSVAEGIFISGYDDIFLDGKIFCDINLGNCQPSLTN